MVNSMNCSLQNISKEVWDQKKKPKPKQNKTQGKQSLETSYSQFWKAAGIADRDKHQLPGCKCKSLHIYPFYIIAANYQSAISTVLRDSILCF